MRKFAKIINILIAVLFIFRPSKDKAEAGKPSADETKYSSVMVSLDKKTGLIEPIKIKVVTSKVSVIKGADLYAMTRQAIDALGGMKTIVKKGDRVFIKPNYITGGLDGHDPVSAGEIAHPEVVASVAEECVKAGAKEVVIGEWVERPIKINFGGKEGKDGAQVQRLVDLLNKKYGHKIFLINLMEHTTYFRYFPSRTKLNFLAIPDLVADADVVISIPALKTHHKPSPVSLGLKNFMGVMPSSLYGEPRYKLHHAGLHQVIVDINKAIQPDLVVVSAAFGMEGPGASLFLGGKAVDVSKRIGGALVIAGRDPVATDATATRIITKDWDPVPANPDLGTPWYVNHIRMAAEQGLGNLDSSKISIIGEQLDNVKMNWERSDDNVYPELPGEKDESRL
ncbi:MAG: DUF362 domain-containing protein [Candidatus Omnitrophota bacterium]|jgi:uncharacterized protein (DUF362 family)